jgi:hypothetical protein
MAIQQNGTVVETRRIFLGLLPIITFLFSIGETPIAQTSTSAGTIVVETIPLETS